MGGCVHRSAAPILSNSSLYIIDPGEYLEPGLFKFDPWDFIVYIFPLDADAPNSLNLNVPCM
jgi:hypothetical protein